MDLRTLVAPVEPSSVADARQFALTCCRDWGVQVDEDALAVVVSELVTVALRRSSGLMTVSVARRPDRVVVSVSDDQGLVGEIGDELFRQVVGALSTAWGEQEQSGGGRLWAEVGTS